MYELQKTKLKKNTCHFIKIKMIKRNPETPSDGLQMKKVPGTACEDNCREDKKKKKISEQIR